MPQKAAPCEPSLPYGAQLARLNTAADWLFGAGVPCGLGERGSRNGLAACLTEHLPLQLAPKGQGCSIPTFGPCQSTPAARVSALACTAPPLIRLCWSSHDGILVTARTTLSHVDLHINILSRHMKVTSHMSKPSRFCRVRHRTLDHPKMQVEVRARARLDSVQPTCYQD